jgi:hypothetical protein
MIKLKVAISNLFYVQEERYVVMPWMARNDHVQEERYVVMPWMARNDDIFKLPFKQGEIIGGIKSINITR